MRLKVEQLHAGYGPVRVLQGTTLGVHDGEIVALLGRNGMGKTTLVHTIMGFIRPTAGRIAVGDRDLAGLPPEDVWRAGVTLMPQGHRVFGSLSVAENLDVAARSTGSDADWGAEDVYRLLPRLKDRARQAAGSLSGGEQQMLTLGRTLVGNGAVVLLDEPVEGLAPATADIFAGIIRELRQRGRAVLLIEQRYQWATQLADRVYVMSRGVQVFQGTPAELDADPGVRSTYLGF